MKSEQSVTSMHEVTPLDKETQPNLDSVEVGEKVPMVPSEGEGDKNLQPDNFVSYEDAHEGRSAIFTREDSSTYEVNKQSVLYGQLKDQVDQKNAKA